MSCAGSSPPLLLLEEAYATAAPAGASGPLGLHRAGTADTLGIAVRAGPVFTLRMAGVLRDLRLPRLRRAAR
ncbi:hypothetical protein ACFXGI_15585 [Streptomyces sp. NPDC059355]|uniref:hypothetical protein n=1 Tax=Streptomyces sp. NPDC059355 TaxID=3346811 RepID=UPI0036C10692